MLIKFIIKLEAQLEPKKVVLVVSDAARRWLADKGYDRLMGARPNGTCDSRTHQKPLADAILFGELSQGGRVEVSADATGVSARNARSGNRTSPSKKEPIENTRPMRPIRGAFLFIAVTNTTFG